MASKKDQPLMHSLQLETLLNFIRLEIEFAFSVENGGRYGRRELRQRMRIAEIKMRQALTEIPMGAYGMGPEQPDDEANEEDLEAIEDGGAPAMPAPPEEEEVNLDDVLDDEEGQDVQVSRV